LRSVFMFVGLAVALSCEFHDVDGVLNLHVIATVKDVNHGPVPGAAIYIESESDRENGDATLACTTDTFGRCDAVTRHTFHGRTTHFGTTGTSIQHRLVIRARGFREKVVPLSQLTRAQAEGQQPITLSEVLSP
jgi:hypothetical protein